MLAEQKDNTRQALQSCSSNHLNMHTNHHALHVAWCMLQVAIDLHRNYSANVGKNAVWQLQPKVAQTVQKHVSYEFQRPCSRLTALWRYINFVLLLLLLSGYVGHM